MSKIRVTPYQNKNEQTSAYLKWFMRVQQNPTIDIDDLATHIANDSKIERSMVATINEAITRQIGELLCNGHPIRIPHLGLLKLGVNSSGTDTVTDYNAGRCVKNVHLVLRPDAEILEEMKRIKFEKTYQQQKA